MQRLLNVCLAAGLALSLTACQSENVKTQYVYPPEPPLLPCKADYGDETGRAITEGLVALVECERAGKAETRAWIDGHKSITKEE